MRSFLSVAVVVASMSQAAFSQSSNDSGWYNKPVPISDQPPARQHDRFNQPGYVRPAQHAPPPATPSPTPVSPIDSTPSVASPTTPVFTAEDYQRSYQPNYIPATATESQSAPTDVVTPTLNLDEERRPFQFEEPINQVTPETSPSNQEASTPAPMPFSVQAQAPTTSQDANVRTRLDLKPQTEASPSPQLPAVAPPTSVAPETTPELDLAQEKRRTLPLSMLLLFGSIGLNIYLIWIAFDTYRRYEDLLSDMRTTRSRGKRGGSQRYSDELAESSAY